jgi:prepilin-type N-terminal cleavage/methylation domain-containing protein
LQKLSCRDPEIKRNDHGFTLIEIIVVVSIIVVFYAIAMPKISTLTGTEMSTKMGRLAADIRSAYDVAVLSGRPYRLVFMVKSGDYWLEAAGDDEGAAKGVSEALGMENLLEFDLEAFDRMPFYLTDQKIEQEASVSDEKGEIDAFDEAFKEYEDLNAPTVEDKDNDRVLTPKSPVLAAKEALRPVQWTRVDNREWQGGRTLGPYLIIKEMQSEHYANKVQFERAGEEDRVMLYFFPSGYVERAYFHIAATNGDGVIDESVPPYTVTTNPFEGTAEVISGLKEMNLSEGK